MPATVSSRIPLLAAALALLAVVLLLAVSPVAAQSQSNNANLRSLNILGTGVVGFSAATTSYTVSLDAPERPADADSDTSADETVDSNWAKVEDVWTGSSDLEYGISGLDNGVGYDVQMRTITTTGGALSGTSNGTSQIPGPAITSVITGDGALTVVWTAPAVAATTAIDAYDLRYIETSADETVDGNWTVQQEFWISGSLHGVLSGLTNGTGYDVQVRAVSDTDGAWSSTSTGTPAEHGNSIGAATTITLGTPVGGAIDPGADEDYFKLVLRSATTILIRTTGDLDTVGELLDSRGGKLDSNDDGGLPQEPRNFVIWRAAGAGTYYVKVSSSEEATGEYILDVRAIGDASSIANAISIDPDSSTLALADEYDDIDFFRLVLLEDSDILIRTSGAIPTTVLELVDNNGVRIVRNDYGYLPPIDSHAVVRSNLAAGTYFIKVNRPRHGDPGPYTLHVNTIAEPGDTIADATQLSLHRAEGGRIDPATDADYFRIVADKQMSIIVRGVSEAIVPGVSEAVDIDGSLLNSSGNPIQANFYEESFSGSRAHGFTVRATLEAGTYYIKVTRSGGADSGPYSILMLNDFQFDDLLNKCSGLNSTFTDPLFGCQWNLENTGQLGGTSGEDINVADVWSGGNTGAGIYVVVVDQQLDLKHEDLNTDETRSHTPADLSRRSDASHGTKVAGIIAARDNDVGGRGVAPDATVIGHAIALPGQSIGSRIVDEADAMTRYSDVAAVFNNSWSGASGPELALAHQHWEEAVKTGVTTGFGGKGVLYVFAAGNDAELEGNANLDEFKNHFHVTTVCATNNLGQRSVYSNHGANLWVCAPSGDRTENHPGLVTTENHSTYVDDFSGTSAAAPTVSGVAALVRAANTSLTWRDVKLILAASARKNDVSNIGWEQGALRYGSATEHYWFNHEYGFGVVDAGSAVNMAKTWVKVPSLASESTAYDRLPVRIPDDRTTVSRPITVGDGVEFVEFVEIEADFQIDNFRQLEVTLESPSGAVSVISQSNAGLHASLCNSSSYSCSLNGSFRFGSARHLGENPEGEWTLRIADRIPRSTPGTLRSWRLTIYGHRDTPAAPTIDKVTPGNVALNVAWSAPTNVGKSSISAYDLRYIRSATTDKSDSEWTVTEDVWTSSGGGALEHEIDGLLVDTQYDVQVRAVNNDGDGQWSAVESAAASTDKAPFIDSLAPGNGSLSISWSAPTSSELGTVTSYDLRYIRSNVSNRLDASWSELTSIWTAGTQEYSLGSLSNGFSYDLQIRAVTGSDQQPWSSAYPETPRTTPSAPSGENIVDSYTSAPGGRTLHVRWNRHITWDPSSNGGAPITGYEIRFIGSDATDKADDNWTVKQVNVYPAPEQEHFLTELENGERYDVQVRGVNDAGAGSWSSTIIGTPSTKPGSPTVDSITAGSRSITVEWSAPESNGGSDISSFDLRYIKTSDLSVTYKPTTIKSAVWTSGDLTATVTSLEAGTQYGVQVRAVNEAGAGPWSAWKAGTTALSADAAELSSLVLTGATLYPSFAARTTSYKASTGYSDTQITITATPRRDDSTVEFLDGSNQPLTDADGADGFQVVLSVGENVVRVRVTASDNVTTETYTVTVSRAGEDRSLTPSPDDTVTAGVLSTARYTVTFQGQWTTDVTPGGLPGGAHFSPIIGAVHNGDVTFLKSDEAASSGVESMAETGGTSELQSEVNAAINAITPTALSVLSRSGNIGRQGQVTLNDVAVTTDHPRVTLVTMIAPSPDWFVGVSGLSLLDASGNWLPSHEVKLYPWDAGTENGDEFSLSNPATSPQGVITSIGGTGKFSTESIATLTFTLRSANSEPTGAPFITGAAEVGEVLAANTSGIDDADGLTSPGYAYRWVRVASGGAKTDISGATSDTYRVQVADVGKQLMVRVSFTDDQNNMQTLTSEATTGVIVSQVTVSFEATEYQAEEGGHGATVKVVLDKEPHRTLNIPLRATQGGGAGPSDYSAPSQITFGSGETEKDAPVSARDDSDDDDGESITLFFGDLPDGVAAGSPSETLVRIVDNDYVPVTLGWEETAFTAEEPTSPGTLTPVTLRAVAVTATDKRPESDFTFDFTVNTANGTARQPGDYERLSSTGTFDRSDFFRTAVDGQFRWVASADYTVNVAHDTVDEPSESFTVRLAFAGSRQPHLTLGDSTATVTTTDDVASLADLLTTVFADSSTVEPGGQLTYNWSVNNSGPAASTNTVLMGTLDASMTFVSAQVASPATGQCGRSGRTVTCAFGTLELGGTASGEIVVEVNDDASADIHFTAIAGADQADRTPADNSDSVTTALDAAPRQITDLRATAARAHIDVTWNTPGDNGTPITSYELERKAGTNDFVPVAPHPLPGATSHRDEDVEEGTEYTYHLRAVNPDGEAEWSNEASATVAVNEPPEFSSSSKTSFNYTENGTSVLYTYRASDPEGDTITWSLSGDDSGDFSIERNTGELTFSTPPDFENPTDADRDNEYLITVEAQDDGFNTGTLDVTVTVTNSTGTEEPTITTTSNPSPYRENETGAVYTFRARDPQGNPVSWSVTGTDSHAFEISSGGALTFGSPPDFENPTDSNRDNEYEISVVVTDEQGLTDGVPVTVTVTNDAEGVEPSISTRRPPSAFRENGTSAVYTFRATDPQRGPITWTLDGTDRGDFTIIPDSSGRGVLAFSNPPDFENPADSDRRNDYELTVIATDEDSHSDRFSFTVTVTDVNEGPEISRVGSAPGSVPENYDLALVLSRYTATDPEGGTVSRWRTSGTDGGDFVVNEQGELRFRHAPDYEHPADSNRDNTYVFTVQVSDGRYYGTFEETVTVTPVNEPPTITTTSSSATELRQNENQTSRLYTYRATDPEGSTVTWSVGGTDERFFAIDERGQFSFSESSPPDFEQPGDSGRDNVYNVTIEVRDDGFNTASLPVTVTVREVNEGPEVTSGQSAFTISENQDLPNAVYSGFDPEGGTVTRWTVGGRDGGDFKISQEGTLTFRNTPDYERPADSNRDNIYELQVRPYDGRYYGSFDVTVTVTPVNEPPIITTTSSSATALRQNENQTSRLYTYRATDPEGSTMTWSVGGVDGRFFTIDERGQFSFKQENPPDYEQPGDSGRDNVYEVTIQARDDGGNTASQPVTVTVRAVNEGPEVTSGQSSFAIDENENLRNAFYSGFDPEGGTVTRWSVGGRDGGDFTITQEGVLTFRSLPDYERPVDSNRDNVYQLQVRPYDGRYYGSFDVTVTVTPVNEPPTITTTSSSATALRQNENQTSRLYTYRATDPEGSTVTWAAGGVDGRFFTIDERGQFSFKQENPPDFEQPGDSGRDNVYAVTVQVRDDGFNTSSLPVTVTVREVNEGPEVTSGQSAFTISENQDLPNAVYSGFDPEGGTVTRWTVGGRDGGDFKISQEGTLTFRNTPDYERPADSNRDNIYELQVRPYDGRYYGSFDVTVTVTDVNEPPTITTTSSSATALQQKENQTSRLYTYRATDPEQGTITWLVGGTDGRFFTIDERGQFSFSESSPPDFEHPGDSGRDNVYDATIQARDDGFNTASLPVTVTVANDAEGVEPTISTRRPPTTYRENGTSAVYTFRASDPQRQSITWTLEGTDRGDFTITGDNSGRGVLAFSVPPDFEDPSDSDRQNDYELTVIATDEDGHSDRLSFTITVTDVNEGPEVSGPSAFTIAENQGLSNAVYAATDPEGANVARWSVGGRDGGDFFITQGGTLYFRSPPDYERPADSNRDNVYEVSIQPADGRNTGSYPVTITVTDVNEAPEFRRGSTTSFTQPENRTSRLYTYSATDPEQGTITWSVGGTDGNHFTIDERGQFSFKEDNPPDFDTPGDDGGDNLYNITIQARDPESNTSSLPVTVMVNEINEGPVITRQGNAPGSVPENHGVNQVLARYTASDPERPSVRITSWSTAGTDGGDFVMNALGELRFRNSPDFERPADSNRDNVYEVTIRASDGRNTGTLEEVQVVTVTDINEPPTITTTSRTTFSQPENRTSTLYTFRATDPEGGTVTWSAGGTDGRYFAIDEQGRFSFREDSPPDFDTPGDADRNNVYKVTVQASDAASNSATLEVSVTVTDHNENVEPTISTRRPPTTYRENGTAAVYTFRASDPQSGTTITWSLTGTDAGDFTITRDSSGRGVLTFNSPPDFESPADADRDNEYELAVVATDDEGNTDRVDFTITVTDDNEGVEPTISTRRPPSTYRENNTSAVYTFRASDPQRETTIRWSVTGNDAGDFTITRDSSGRGVLTFNSPPDFESPADANRDNEYELAVMATDDESNTDRVDFTIAVTDIDEGPQVSLQETATTTVPENTADTQVLARFTATDPENPNAPIFQWSTSGRDGGDFVISELGELRFRSSPNYERPADSNRDNVYEVTIRASDGRSYGMLQEPLSVTVTEVNEAPVITTKSRTEFSLRENSTSTLYTYRATDQDNNDIIRWSVEGADGGNFAIYTGVLTFRLLPDLENPVDSDEDNVYEITVVAADRAGLRDTVNAVITITDQSEGPVIAGRTSFTVTENYDITQVLGSYTATDAKDARTVHPQWSLSGRDSGDFVIDRVSGALTFRNTPDYDRPADGNRDNVYEVTVRGHDSRAYGNLNVTVTVTNINEEAPVVTGRNSLTVRENTTSSIYTYRATDSDLNDTIVWSTGGADGHLFQVSDRGELRFREAPDFETPRDAGQDNEYALEVVATDGEGLRGTLAVTVTVTELNEGPVVSGTPTFAINENQDLPSANYTATDPEATGGVTTSITWSVSGRDGGDFTIDRETGALTFRSLPDYERPADSNRDNEYEVTVRAYDGRSYGTFDVTVTVLAVNEGPEITGRDTFRYRENGTSALYTYRATDPERDEYTWGLGGLDASHFEISDRGVLTFASPPNFDSPAGSGTDGNEYLVTVQARDDQGNTGELPVTITVTDQNEGATVSGRTEIAVQENRDPTLILATYTASDPEGQAITRWSLGGSDSGDFSISGDGELTFRNTPDYDRPADSNRDNEYRVTVRAYDGSTYGNLDVTITVSNQNEHDPIIRSGSTTSFNYREESTSALYTYRATDQDKDDVITWTTAGADGYLFEFNNRNALTFREPPDYEDPRDAGRDNQYELAVVATDSGGLSDRLDVTVTVTAVDEGPEITGTTTYTVTEGQELTGATFTARDPEDPTIDVTNWRTSGTDGGDFTISQDGELSFRSTPDYERPADSNRDNVYLVTVQASDGRNYGSLDVTVTVTDQNESNPEVSGRDALSVRENTTSTLYTYSARDMDRGAEIMWSVRGTDSDDFTIGDTGELSFSSNPDHEQPADSDSDNVYEITVVASDGQNEGTLDVTVTVTEVNEGPKISGRDTLTVSENYEAVLATYSGTDPEDASAEITRWSVTGRDGGDFTINELGELTFRRPPDYERPADSDRDNEYEVTVRASDGKVYGIYEVAVNVEAVDEAPEFQRGSRDIFSYRENGASSLYTYRATDPEGAEVAWSVSGADGEDFEMSASGVLSFEEAPDYDDPADDDDDNEYEVTVVATDQTGNAASLTVTVTVTDVNEGPIISGAGEFTVRENYDALLGTYTARDPEDTDLEITRWSLSGSDGGDFSINEKGELSFRNPPDYERPADSNRDNVYQVTVRASDSRNYGNFEVTVTVEAVNEPPDVTGDDTVSYQENGTASLATYRATDPEGSDITWELSGTDSSAFGISETGVLTFLNAPDYESPTDSGSDNVYEVTVEATDEDGETGRMEVTVTVVNLTD